MTEDQRDAVSIVYGLHSTHADDQITCAICKTTAYQFSKDALGWDWFTGFLDETAHFCPDCRVRHWSFITTLRGLASSHPILRPAHSLMQARDQYLSAVKIR
ncbi:hypothetical protein AWB67_06431 [Caballeronia terrestris]|uniref:Uncharacterized protein n=1 Tax=Caballeronia terrestris TaxID=1226301 RepID=A0A158KQU2_9BURK|nr:hypothetical protein [Caballeronia terrestris]SAL83526.1 hypothetical protein AWB67_06431 [Caballeronia terrestris]